MVEDLRAVRDGVVVAEEGGAGRRLVGEVAVPEAQVLRRGPGGVVDVVRVLHVVRVLVRGPTTPGTREELHRPDRTVPGGIVVQPPAVGVVDRDGARPPVE